MLEVRTPPARLSTALRPNVNLGSEPFTVKRGDRIALLILALVSRALFTEHAELAASECGSGFGSTGIRRG